MKRSVNVQLALVMFGTLLVSGSALADIRYIQSLDGKISEVPAANVKTACRKNFVFRDVGKNEVDPFYQSDIIRAALTGAMVPSFALVLEKLKAESGKCSWAMPEEKW